ncbi:hypothetical protein JHK87_006233 [Glycine soja]|nr:hypothetical protein JHK87_006233 [Glycine soja]KAG5071175.1 hypothetical protein JHK86_006386 [Glycine max]
MGKCSVVKLCLTIGSYSKWLDYASEAMFVLPLVLDILMNGMGTYEECAVATALAFRSMVVTELPQDDAKRALEALCIPVITHLQEGMHEGPESLSKRPSRQLTIHID